jgi:glycerol kinase
MTHTTLILDQGTHATRAMVLDERGRILVSAMLPVSLARISETRVEQNGLEILESVRQSLSSVLKAAGEKRLEIARAGLATQRSSVLAWDRVTGEPLSPVISWQDRRAARALSPLVEKGESIHRLSGLPISPHYGAGKLRWLLENNSAVKGALDAGRLAWGPLASFLLFHLLEGGGCLVDHANAQRTQLWNLHTRDWDEALLSLFGLPADPLPACRPVMDAYGRLKAADIPLCVVTGDQNAALFSLGGILAHSALVNLGTGAFVLAPTGRRPLTDPRLISTLAVSDRERGDYVLEGTVNGAGAALDWAADRLGVASPHALLPVSLAGDGAPPLFMNAVGGLGSPWWRPEERPRWIGGGSPALRMLAVVESILFLVQANLDVMVASGCEIRILVVTGGLARLNGVCDRLAALSQRPVYRPAETEATVRGTAWLAAGRPAIWPRPGRGKWFRPRPDMALSNRYQRFSEEMGNIV